MSTQLEAMNATALRKGLILVSTSDHPNFVTENASRSVFFESHIASQAFVRESSPLAEREESIER